MFLYLIHTMTNLEVKNYLQKHADKRYADFAASLIPGVQKMLGVRIPVLRSLAKKLVHEDWRSYLSQATDDCFEETMLQGLVIGAAQMPLDELLKYMSDYASKITDWSLCDSPCTGFKSIRKYREEVWSFLQPYLYSGDEFRQRFALVILLSHYIADEFADRVLDVCGRVRPTGYYDMMAVAWCVSVCMAKYPDATRRLLTSGLLENKTRQKAIQKILDSYRISEEDKAFARSLRSLDISKTC